MLDIGFVERVVLDLAATGRIEDFFLDRGVDLELGADLRARASVLRLSALAFSNVSNSSSTLRWSAFSKRDRVGVLLLAMAVSWRCGSTPTGETTLVPFAWLIEITRPPRARPSGLQPLDGLFRGHLGPPGPLSCSSLRGSARSAVGEMFDPYEVLPRSLDRRAAARRAWPAWRTRRDLRILDEKDHQEGNDGRAGVDDELPGLPEKPNMGRSTPRRRRRRQRDRVKVRACHGSGNGPCNMRKIVVHVVGRGRQPTRTLLSEPEDAERLGQPSTTMMTTTAFRMPRILESHRNVGADELEQQLDHDQDDDDS